MFPSLYHAHHNLQNEDLPFWIALSDEYRGSILELGTGTGRVLVPLLHNGRKIVGLDIDHEMLKFLLENLPDELRSQPAVFQADFTAFRLAARFDLILMTCNTYSTLTPEMRWKTLQCVVEHLQPGGIFAFSSPNPELLKRLPQVGEAEIEEIFPHPIDHEPVQVSSEWIREAHELVLYWHYDHLLPDGTVERLSSKIIHQLAQVSELRAELLAAGFKELQVYGDFDRSRLTRSSPTLIMIARI